MDLTWLMKPESWAAILTLATLEIILGVDNIIHLTLTSNKLPQAQQHGARLLGLILAMCTRVALLFSIVSIMQYGKHLFTAFGHVFSFRDTVLLLGGFFLVSKSLLDLTARAAGTERATRRNPLKASSMQSVLLQIVLLDMVFSIDSIITAVGMSRDIRIMAAAVIISVAAMALFTDKISECINNRPRLQPLAMYFLVVVGLVFMLEAFGVEVPKAPLYLAVFAFLGFELLTTKQRQVRQARHAIKRALAKTVDDWSDLIPPVIEQAAEFVVSAPSHWLTGADPDPCRRCSSVSHGVSSCLDCGQMLESGAMELGQINYSFHKVLLVAGSSD